MTALHHAARYHAHELIPLLSTQRTSQNSQDELEYTPLQLAVMNVPDRRYDNNEIIPDTEKTIMSLLVHNADMTGILLHAATKESMARIIPQFVARGADPNAKDKDGNTPLHIAVRLEHTAMIKTLLSVNADAGVINKRGTILHLRAEGLGPNNLSHEIISELVKKGADLNAKDEEGYTALQQALMHRQFSLARNLITVGANVKVIGKNSETVLHLTIGSSTGYSNEHELELIDLLSRLVKEGAEINARNINGNTALLEVCNQYHRYTKRIIKFLLY